MSNCANKTMPSSDFRRAMLISDARARRRLNYTVNTLEYSTVSSAGQAVCEDNRRDSGSKFSMTFRAGATTIERPIFTSRLPGWPRNANRRESAVNSRQALTASAQAGRRHGLQAQMEPPPAACAGRRHSLQAHMAPPPDACADRRHGLQAHTAPPPPIRFRHGSRWHTHTVPSRHGRTMHSPSQLYAILAQDNEASRERMRRLELMGVERRERLRLSRLRINVLPRENRDNHREVHIMLLSISCLLFDTYSITLSFK
jgi:hypothetical protein